MNRITREQMMMEWAHTAAKRSTCGRLAVGAVICRHSHPISAGYVGAPSGMPHCEENGCDLTKPCTRTQHAEQNALEFAKREGIRVEGADMFTTDSPCIQCAEAIIRAGINRLFFDREYRISAGIELLLQEGVEVYRILANGMTRRYYL